MATAAAVSNTSIGDGLTTRDGGEVEDFVQMSLAEFKQLTDLVKEQSQEIEQLYEELSIIDKFKKKLVNTAPLNLNKPISNNMSVNKQRRTTSMGESWFKKKVRNPNGQNNNNNSNSFGQSDNSISLEINRNVSIFGQEIEANQAMVGGTNQKRQTSENLRALTLKNQLDEISALKDECKRLKTEHERSELRNTDLQKYVEVINGQTNKLHTTKQQWEEENLQLKQHVEALQDSLSHKKLQIDLMHEQNKMRLENAYLLKDKRSSHEAFSSAKIKNAAEKDVVKTGKAYVKDIVSGGQNLNKSGQSTKRASNDMSADNAMQRSQIMQHQY